MSNLELKVEKKIDEKSIEAIAEEKKVTEEKIEESLNYDSLSKEEKSDNEFLRDLLISSDTFIIDRPDFGTKSVIAGYPWFLDWGRDTFISFEGLFLITKRFEDAKNVFRTFTREMKEGLVPNRFF